jgi:hypothetical protein
MNKEPEIFTAVICLLFLSFSGLFAQTKNIAAYDISTILDSSVVTELKQNGEIKHTLAKGETALLLVPDTPFAKKAVSFNNVNDIKNEPSFISESLHIIKKTELTENSKNKGTDTSLDAVSRVLRSISKMKGMMYYSNSRKEWDVLYNESYMIESPDSETAVPDKTDGPADGLILYCYQNEHTFGNCKYRLDYGQSNTEVSVLFTNIEPLYYTVIRAVKTGSMNINLVVSDCGDSYLVYMVIHADIVRFSLLEKRMNNSLNSRLDAIYKWFTMQF